jgi:DNA (cytosine-5)-methyltransferase 1
MIPIVDIFAGPGGLGEGFTSWNTAGEKPAFTLALSIEKDEFAHATLRHRALWRALSARERQECIAALAMGADWEDFAWLYPNAAAAAEEEALLLELGPKTTPTTRRLIRTSLRRDEAWVLVGGPPCQAYSLVGRARRSGSNYVASKDKRQTLYVEYLQILADHAPPVFVMENVKGLLSATLNSGSMFQRIVDDLQNPGVALKREKRTSSRRPRYTIRALASGADHLKDDPAQFVVRSEEYGIPQSRHRVILLGVREDVVVEGTGRLSTASRKATVKATIAELPSLRSGISKAADSAHAWRAFLKGVKERVWIKEVDASTRERIAFAIDDLSAPTADRGSDCLPSANGAMVFNHSARSHIGSDLDRYLFASAFAEAHSRSPKLEDFPGTLLPKHENVEDAVENGLFSDRFRVQLADRPSSTITSHIAKDGHYYIHYDPKQCRSLTVREAARLQTFPDDYFFCGPRTAQYQQVGNAVPPALARQIAAIVYQIVA